MESPFGPKNLPRGINETSTGFDVFNLFNTPIFRKFTCLPQCNLYASQIGAGITKHKDLKSSGIGQLTSEDLDRALACLVYTGVKPAPRMRTNWLGHQSLRNPCIINALPTYRKFGKEAGILCIRGAIPQTCA